MIAINYTPSLDLDIVSKSGENRIHQLEQEQKRASIAIIKARENRQRNWTDYSTQTISVLTSDPLYEYRGKKD